MYREKVKLPYRGDWKLFNFIIVWKQKKKLKKKNDCAQRNDLGVSLVGQVDWNTEPVCFFSLDILFFSARPRRFGEKKVTRNIEKKAHGLTPVKTSQKKAHVVCEPWASPSNMHAACLACSTRHACQPASPELHAL